MFCHGEASEADRFFRRAPATASGSAWRAYQGVGRCSHQKLVPCAHWAWQTRMVALEVSEQHLDFFLSRRETR